MKTTVLVYPHQLWERNPAIESSPSAEVLIVEEPLYFTYFSFAPSVLSYRRETMRRYYEGLRRSGVNARILPLDRLPHSGAVAQVLSKGTNQVVLADPVDDWLERRLRHTFSGTGGTPSLRIVDGPGFVLTRSEIPEDISAPPTEDAQSRNRRLSMATFYRDLRERFGILLQPDGSPEGGRWSFDRDNRRRIPKNLKPPTSLKPEDNGVFPVPVTADGASAWLTEFLRRRIDRFGDYEDAIDRRDDRWFHSLLSPMLNAGLLTPRQVIDETLLYAEERHHRGSPIPLNSLEGFIRQLLGWREYVRATYVSRGGAMRTRNFWNHTNPMPLSFYQGTTGLPPFDRVVQKIHRLGWAHHIERLMIAGNLMLLCEIHPDAVYRWFMELFLDAWDWVMVPNVYGMSQYADGGTITTKPYVSGSSYIRRMTDAPRGDWEEVWDGLFWRFVDRHRDTFASNPRTSMMAIQLGRLDGDRLRRVLAAADRFLATLW